MNRIWNLNDVTVSGITTNRFIDDTTLVVCGTGTRHRGDNILIAPEFEWEATVTPQGWLVTIIKATGRIGQIQGSTFNLALEVAAIARKLA